MIPRVFVIGYGNPGRRDDGLGPALAARLRDLRLPGVHVEEAYQLSVEHAAAVAEHDVAIFADASVDAEAPYRWSRLEPRHGPLEFTTHSLAPDRVLGLAHEVFAARTAGWALAIRGHTFEGFGERLSAGAAANLENALTFLAAALRQREEFPPAVQPEGRDS